MNDLEKFILNEIERIKCENAKDVEITCTCSEKGWKQLLFSLRHTYQYYSEGEVTCGFSMSLAELPKNHYTYNGVLFVEEKDQKEDFIFSAK